MSHFFERIYTIVQQIPPGRVATYGQIAALCEHPRAARTVGWALHSLGEPGSSHPYRADNVPWWRVINASGYVSHPCQTHPSTWQQELLKAEGVIFGPDDRVDLRRFRWDAEEIGYQMLKGTEREPDP